MIRAVVRNQRGDITRGPFNFQSQGDYDEFVARFNGGPTRFREDVEIVNSPLTFEEAVMLDGLQSVALNANGFLKFFIMDGDFHRRLKNRELNADDIKTIATTLLEASDSFRELAAKERGIEVPA